MEKRLFKRMYPVLLWTVLLSGMNTACSDENDSGAPLPEESSPYITKVLDYRPAAGQFINTMPEYETGDTQEDMNRKALEAIGNNNRGMISLGGFGGYIVVGFNHTIENKPGLCDFRVLGNAFYASGQTEYGSSEPGIIQVAYDANGNGQPDDNEWYEIAGSAHSGGREPWFEKLQAAGNDIRTVGNYQITYHRPDTEPSGESEQYIRWTDNEGGSGYIAKNSYHKQSYFPQWIEEEELVFQGTRLPQNGLDLSGEGNNFVLYKFTYGYADNETNISDASAIDIGWAVDAEGNPADLPGADFIRIYTGVNQSNGWLGENSTEIMGVEDLHLLKINIESSTLKK